MGSKCKIATGIIVCFLIILAISAVLIYFIINNSVNRHAERCVIRHLYNDGKLRDVKFEESPLSFEYEGCDDAINNARQRVRDEIKIPCDLHDNKEFIRELEDLGMLSGIYERIHHVEKANDIKKSIGIKIINKCEGMRDLNVRNVK
ncbi:uncharacterized protein [Chironomus tepperi]|uniref:uncharacterized protein n=1 Tax=Chironomus tepperi TaxID=113505 RepID=UPI00391EED03